MDAKTQLAAGASIAMGATLAATGNAQADTLTVTNLNDDGAGSLRDATVDANQNGPGSDDIVFASGLSGTIDVGSSFGFELLLGTAMTIQGDGRITLRAASDALDHVIYTAPTAYVGNPGDPITLSGLTITGGHAAGHAVSDDGGGVFNLNASLTVSNSVISGNHADDDGGGIYSRYGSLTLVDSTVSGNTTGGAFEHYGGAIYSQDSPVVIRNSTLSGNSSGGVGGGIYMSSGANLDPSLTIENSTIADNFTVQGGGEGGGVFSCCGDDGQRLDIRSSTITGNSAGALSYGGGVYAYVIPSYDPAGRTNIQSTILANNTGAKGNDLFLRNGGSVGFSLIEDPNTTNAPETLTVTGPNITGQDPQLGPLADNGGPTQTEAPASSSPIIDKGSAGGLTSDQRGVMRPIDFPGIPNAPGGDGSDIGAFELQPDNRIKLGKLKRNPARGTAGQTVLVPQPGAGTLTISGKGLKTRKREVAGSGKVKLPVIPKGVKRRLESLTGKVKARARITYRPTGAAETTLSRKLKLLKR